jgi:virulence-associated protein VagC
MQRKAKIFMNNRSQAVRLPKEFQFNVQEVFIRKEGSDVVLYCHRDPLTGLLILLMRLPPHDPSWKGSRTSRCGSRNGGYMLDTDTRWA